MDPELKDAIITFFRGLFAAAVGAAVAYVASVNLFTTAPSDITKGIIMAAITGALLFLGAWARNATTVPVQIPTSNRDTASDVGLAGPHHNRTRSWADSLPI